LQELGDELFADSLSGASTLSDGMGTAWASIMPQIYSKGRSRRF